MMHSKKGQQQPDQIQKLLERFEREQREYENHPLWKQLGTTPKAFASMVREKALASGISADAWQEKVQRQAEVIRTQMRESIGAYEVVNFKHFSGLRA